MNEIETILEQGRLFVVQHAPSEVLTSAVPAAIVFLIAGIGLSVLGAKLARFGMTAAFVVLGGLAGVWFGRELGFSPLPCVLVGAFLIGIISYLSFRLLVGLAAAVVFSSVVVGAFGYHRVIPYVSEFEQTLPLSASANSSTFVIPSTEQQQAYRDRDPRRWATEFWAFVTARDSNTARNSKAITIVALLTGLCLGLLAVRWALIISTSIVGTSLVTAGVATLLTHSVPESYQAFQNNPGLLGIGVGGFLVTSLIVQTMLSRQSPSGKGESRSSS